jgi:hypothetical protein
MRPSHLRVRSSPTAVLLSELIKTNAITQGSVSILTTALPLVSWPVTTRQMLIVIALPLAYRASVTFSILSSSGKYTDRRSKCNPVCGHVQRPDPPLLCMHLQRKKYTPMLLMSAVTY